MSLTETVTSAHPERAALRWCDALDRAFADRDPDAVAALCTPDAHWRDVLALTWHLHTVTGTDAIRELLAPALTDAKPGEVVLRADPAPRTVRRGGVEAVEALFDLRTAYGRGSGVVRLVTGDDGVARAWNVLTTLEELDGHPEPVGERRPRGALYSRNFGGPNWLDHRERERAYAGTDPAVLVVGCGQAGLGIAARLRHLGVDTLVVDRMARVGDNWRNRYHALSLHNQIWVNHLPYLPFPDSWPVYVPKDKLAGWFEFYAEAMELNVWTGTEFVGAVRDEAGGGWVATVRRDGDEQVLRPRHVVLATGVSGIPNRPDLPGLDDFRGDVVHSGAYRDGAPYRGRPALVVGTGNSGHDVAQDLHGHGARVTMVQRGSTTVVTADPTAQKVYGLYAEGLRTEDADLVFASVPYPVLVDTYRQVTGQMREDDRELTAGLESVGFRTDWGADDTGFQMKYLRRGGGYYLDVGCSGLIVDGEIGLLRDERIDRFVADGVRLRDGSVVPAELVVLATGYRPQQEMVRALFGDAVGDRVGPVWGHDAEGELRNMWRRTAQPGLWFTAGSLAQSRVFSRYLALQIAACEAGLIDPADGPAPAA